MSTVSPAHVIEQTTVENYLTVVLDKLSPGRSAGDASVADSWLPLELVKPPRIQITSWLFARVPFQLLSQPPGLLMDSGAFINGTSWDNTDFMIKH